MVQVAKSTKDFELFRGANWHRQSEYLKFKSRSDFSQMRRFRARKYRIWDHTRTTTNSIKLKTASDHANAKL